MPFRTTRLEEPQLRSVIEEMPVSIAMFDREMRYLAASQLWLDTFCDGARDVCGRSHYDVFPKIPQRWREVRKRALAGETIRQDDDPFERLDGRVQWVCWEVRPWHRADRKIGGIIIFANDVTARVETEQGVRENNANLTAETKALARLTEVSSRLWQTQDLHDGLDEMLAATIELLGADMGSVQLWHAERNVLLIAAHRGLRQDFLEFFREVLVTDDSAAGRAIRTGDTVVIEDIERDEPLMPFRPIVRAAGSRAIVSAPLLGRGGVRLGVLAAHFRTPHRPTDFDLQRLKLYQLLAANFIEHCANEKILRESEERFRALVTATSFAVFLANADWTEICQFDYRGFPSDTTRPGEALLHEYIHQKDQSPVLEAIDEAIRVKNILDLEHRVQRADGTAGWVHLRAVPLLDASGEIREWFGAAQDVTARKQTEDALRESEERLRLAVEASRMAMWDWDIRTKRFTRNDEYRRLFGYRAGEIEPDYATWAQRIHPDDRATAEAVLASAVRDRKKYLNEYRVLHPDGTVRWCIARGDFVYDDAGEPIRMMGLTEDITEVRQQAEQQRVLVAELQHRTRNLMAVVQSVAHQTLRTAKSLEDFGNRFDRRLDALSRVQNLLSRTDTQPIGVGALIGMELEALSFADLGKKVTIAGPEVPLRKNAVQMFSLAIHELATNALKYGALANSGGRLSVTWRIDETELDRRLLLEWIERGIATPRSAADTERRGYGRTLIEQALPYTLSAKTRFDLDANTLRCVISLPLTTKDGKEMVG